MITVQKKVTATFGSKPQLRRTDGDPRNVNIWHLIHNTLNPHVSTLRINCKNTYNSESVPYTCGMVIAAMYASDEGQALYPLRRDTATFLTASTVKVYKS